MKQKLITIKLKKKKEVITIDIYNYKTGYQYIISDNMNDRKYLCNDSTKEQKVLNKLIDKKFKEIL